MMLLMVHHCPWWAAAACYIPSSEGAVQKFFPQQTFEHVTDTIRKQKLGQRERPQGSSKSLSYNSSKGSLHECKMALPFPLHFLPSDPTYWTDDIDHGKGEKYEWLDTGIGFYQLIKFNKLLGVSESHFFEKKICLTSSSSDEFPWVLLFSVLGTVVWLYINSRPYPDLIKWCMGIFGVSLLMILLCFDCKVFRFHERGKKFF